MVAAVVTAVTPLPIMISIKIFTAKNYLGMPSPLSPQPM
jgi:hypothetical protein